MRVTLLSGGVGGAKLALGFYRSKCELTVIANTGDDIVMHDLHVSPDPDILIYTLADVVHAEQGWGFRDESFHVAKGLAQYGRETWFQLGDRDLATHIHRSAMLASGATLSEAIDSIRKSLGVTAPILPMSDDSLRTMLHTQEGVMHLQEYMVRRCCEPVVREIAFEGAASAVPAPGVIDAIRDVDLVVIAPSNPLISIGPMLAVSAIREALCRRRESVVAVCPIIGGKSLKGPTDKMMAQLGHDVSPAGVAGMYRDLAATLILDTADDGECAAVKAAGMMPVLMPTVMRSTADKQRLAEAIMARCGSAA